MLRTTMRLWPSIIRLILLIMYFPQAFAGFSIGQVEDKNSIRWGGIDWIPELQSRYGYDSNVNRSNENEVSSNTFVNHFQLDGLAQHKANRYRLGFGVTHGLYTESQTSDYTSVVIDASTDLTLNKRNRMELWSLYDQSTEQRGTGFSEGSTELLDDDSDEYRWLDWGVDYHFGSRDAKGAIELSYLQRHLRYRNDRDRTRVRDHNQQSFFGQFNYRPSDKTLLFVRSGQLQLRYPNETDSIDEGNLDSNETVFNLGARLQAANKLRVDISAGVANRDFIDASETVSSPTWSVSTAWSPKRHMVFTFLTSQAYEESTGTGNYQKSQSWSLSWQHGWNERFSSVLAYDYRDEDIETLELGTVREDLLGTVAFSVTYQFRRWLSMGLDTQWEQQRSDEDNFEFERDVYLLFIELHL